MITLLFGFGFMSEGSDYTIGNFDFIVGLENDETGFVNQVDTSDIAWSVFVIRFGIVGTILYLIYYFLLVKFFNSRINTNGVKAVFSTLALVFITSFTGVTILKMEFLAIILLMYLFIDRKRVESIGKNA